MKRFLAVLTLVAVVPLVAGCGGETAPDGEKDATAESNSAIGYADDAGAFDAAAYEDEIRDEIYRSAYEEGQADGYNSGYDDGHQDGYDEGYFDGCVWLGRTLVANGADIWYQC